MKKVLSLVLALAVFSTLAMAGAQGVTVSYEMTGAESDSLVGAGSWSDFLTGLACGLGTVAVIAGVATGAGAVVSLAAASGVAATCAAAIGI